MLTRGVVVYHFKTKLYAVNLVQKMISLIKMVQFQWIRAYFSKVSLLFSLTYQAYFPIHCALIQHRWILVSAKPKLLQSFKNTCSLKNNLQNQQQIRVAIDGGHLMYTMVNWHKESYSDS